MPTSATSASASEDAPLDERDEERRNVARLIRVMAGFIAFPSLTIALAFVVFEGPTAHWMHIAGLSAAFILAAAGFVAAPRLAVRFVE